MIVKKWTQSYLCIIFFIPTDDISINNNSERKNRGKKRSGSYSYRTENDSLNDWRGYNVCQLMGKSWYQGREWKYYSFSPSHSLMYGFLSKCTRFLFSAYSQRNLYLLPSVSQGLKPGMVLHTHSPRDSGDWGRRLQVAVQTWQLNETLSQNLNAWKCSSVVECPLVQSLVLGKKMDLIHQHHGYPTNEIITKHVKSLFWIECINYYTAKIPE